MSHLLQAMLFRAGAYSPDTMWWLAECALMRRMTLAQELRNQTGSHIGFERVDIAPGA